MKRTRVAKKEQLLPERTATQDILAVIFAFPEVEFSLTELAQSAEVSKSTTSRLLQRLSDHEIIKVENKGVVFRIRANIGKIQYTKRKIVHNLNLLYESGLVEFLDSAFGHSQAIILFGSFRKGDDISTSDIDIAVETLEDINTQTIIVEGIEKFEAALGKKVQILLFNRKKTDVNVFNNIANGIVLSGFLEVHP